MEYKIIKIPKKNGLYRSVYSVDDYTKSELRKLLPLLERLLLKFDKLNINYGFINGRNCVLNAFQHVGYNYTLSMDLVDFFDSVKRHHLEGIVDDHILKKCLIENSPKQGLPTSPLLANIAFAVFDKKIFHSLQKLGLKFTYTRYADDLTFSFNDQKDSGKIQFVVKQVLRSSGFFINSKKTKLQNIRNGRIVITGVGVDRNGIHATRKTRKKIRAARHQRSVNSLIGLLEWEKCKFPNKLWE
jgi:hypothetical protein